MLKINFTNILIYSFLLWVVVFTGSTLAKVPEHEVRGLFDDDSTVKLVVAASHGDIDAIDKLVSEGADVNARGRKGITPLVFMLSQKNMAGFARLLSHGADPNLLYDGKNSIMRALSELDDSEFLKIAIEYGGDVNAISGNQSIIFYAIKHGRADNVKVLIDSGADINFQNKVTGKTPLHIAGIANQYKIAYILLKSGADYSINDNLGRNGLIWGIENNGINQEYEPYQWREKVINYLSDVGINTNPRHP